MSNPATFLTLECRHGGRGCSMVAAFGSGAVFSAVSGMGGPNLAGNALTTGFFFALVQGGIYKVDNVHLLFTSI